MSKILEAHINPPIQIACDTAVNNEIVRLEIIEKDGGFYLFAIDSTGTCRSDSWHVSVDEATSQAAFDFPLSTIKWHGVKHQ